MVTSKRMGIYIPRKKARAFLKKSAAKNFCEADVARAIGGLRASR
jgi:hypothetical protein